MPKFEELMFENSLKVNYTSLDSRFSSNLAEFTVLCLIMLTAKHFLYNMLVIFLTITAKESNKIRLSPSLPSNWYASRPSLNSSLINFCRNNLVIQFFISCSSLTFSESRRTRQAFDPTTLSAFLY